MRLSIVVTVFNREDLIQRCLNSLVDQGLSSEEYEILIINDGSTDKSLEKIDEIKKNFPQIRVISQKNGGLANARNTGLKYARGRYLAYIDSDDTAQIGGYKKLLEIAEKEDCDILLHDAIKKYSDSEEYFHMNNESEGFLTPQQYILGCPSAWNKFVKKELYELANASFPDGYMYEDYATMPILAKVAKRIYYKKYPLIYYYQDNESITRTKGYQKYWIDLLHCSKCLEGVKQTFPLEIEYIVYRSLLLETGKLLLEYDKYDLITEISKYMKKEYPNLKYNKYIKEQSLKEKFIANMLYHNKAKMLKAIVKMKKKVK